MIMNQLHKYKTKAVLFPFSVKCNSLLFNYSKYWNVIMYVRMCVLQQVKHNVIKAIESRILYSDDKKFNLWIAKFTKIAPILMFKTYWFLVVQYLSLYYYVSYNADMIATKNSNSVSETNLRKFEVFNPLFIFFI